MNDRELDEQMVWTDAAGWVLTRPDRWHVDLTVNGHRRNFTNRAARRLAWALLAAAEQGDG